jgi:molybdopterin converting factor small subunit
MNVEIEFIGFSAIFDIFEGPRTMTFIGSTLLELIEDLIDQYGARVEESLKDRTTKALDPAVQVRINGSYIVGDNILDQRISEGDKVTFLRLLAGG